MAYKENEKTLNVDLDKELFLAFEEQRVNRRQLKKGAAEWAIRTWLSLPAEIQATIIDNKPTDLYDFLVNQLLRIT